MADRMRVVLKTGKEPGPGEDDTRTAYDGRIKKGVETSFQDDQCIHYVRLSVTQDGVRRTTYSDRQKKAMFNINPNRRAGYATITDVTPE